MTTRRPTTMTALFGGLGPDWQAREVPVPEPGPGQVLVRARAVSLNHADVPLLRQSYDPSTGQGEAYQAGYEFAGEVVALGDGVDTLAVGRPVMGTAPRAFAQYVPADHRHVIGIPEGIGYEEAAALPTGLLTEHGALSVSGFRPGHRVLITGATSAIGLLGIRIAKTLGASGVLATTRSPSRAALLTAAGADTVIVTTRQDLTQAVLKATGGDGADIVLDHVGGPAFAACLPATRTGGHVVNIGRLDGSASTVDLDALSYRNLTVHGVSYGFIRPANLGRVITALTHQVLPAVADGRIRPVIDSVHGFHQAQEAAQRIRTHQARGKTVLTVP
ncbi:zinc-binding dehydrogenase [Streptomyces sp. NPDC006872]|uniref:quinone oxidoreductase family protein n=1 Tax=Streptomyces sp. NPDC006872 TaxID=3155720 RepID=UPI0033EB6D5B